jgi:hypothetical protein
MSAEQTSAKEMGPGGRAIGVFISPRETFESIDRKPTWLVPFLVVIIASIILQLLVLDIGIQDRLDTMRAQELPDARIEAARTQMAGPLRYVGVAITPVAVLVIWAVLGGIFLFTGNTIMGGEAKFKKIFSLFAWTSLIGVLGGILKTLLILAKGSTRGVVLSLAFLLPPLEKGESPSMIYRFLDRFDFFTIWSLILWAFGFAVIYRFTTKKSAIMVFSLWAIYIVLVVVLGGLLSGIFGG